MKSPFSAVFTGGLSPYHPSGPFAGAYEASRGGDPHADWSPALSAAMKDEYVKRLRESAKAYLEKNPCLAEAFGIDPFFDNLIDAAENYVTGIKGNSLGARWRGSEAEFSGRTIVLPGGSLPGDMVLIHETVHAVDRQHRWYLGYWGRDDIESAEALAYGTQHLLEQYDHFTNLLKFLSKNSDMPCSDIQNNLNRLAAGNGWDVTYGRIGQALPRWSGGWSVGVRGPGKRPGSAKDIADIGKRLGLKPNYKKIIDCFKKCCPDLKSPGASGSN